MNEENGAGQETLEALSYEELHLLACELRSRLEEANEEIITLQAKLLRYYEEDLGIEEEDDA